MVSTDLAAIVFVELNAVVPVTFVSVLGAVAFAVAAVLAAMMNVRVPEVLVAM
jgi:hypothetical protein